CDDAGLSGAGDMQASGGVDGEAGNSEPTAGDIGKAVQMNQCADAGVDAFGFGVGVIEGEGKLCDGFADCGVGVDGRQFGGKLSDIAIGATIGEGFVLVALFDEAMDLIGG